MVLTNLVLQFTLLSEYLSWIMQGYRLTLFLSLSSCFLASLIGALICAMRIGNFFLFSLSARFYIAVFRNTPLLVQLFFWYFGVSRFVPDAIRLWLLTSHNQIIWGITLSFPSYEFIYGFIGLTFYTSAYVAEELRAGIQTVPYNQKNAALALGFSHCKAFLFILAPQAIRNALSPLLGQYIGALKNSSLTAAIGVGELFYTASQIETRSLMAFQIYFIVTLLFIGTIALIEFISILIEKQYRTTRIAS